MRTPRGCCANPSVRTIPLCAPCREKPRPCGAERAPAAPTNPYIALEKWWAGNIVASFDFWRDVRDMLYEATFLSLYGSPLMDGIAETHAFKRTLKDPRELRFLPEVQAVLLGVSRGGFEEAVIRMLILLAEARGSVRRDRLERSAKVLTKDEPFASLGAERRAALIREQSIIAEFDADHAIATLNDLLPEPEQRKRAMEVVEFIAGAIEDMEPHTIKTLQRLRDALGLAPIALPDAATDPLQQHEDMREAE